MKKRIVFLLCCISSICHAQTDSFFVACDNNVWIINYAKPKEETIFQVAKKFHVPPAILADFNHVSLQSNVAEIKTLKIPIAAYNCLKQPGSETKTLYFRALKSNPLISITNCTTVSLSTIESWNDNKKSSDFKKGQAIVLGWLLYDPTPQPIKSNKDISTPTKKTAVENSKSLSSNPNKLPTKTTVTIISPKDSVVTKDTVTGREAEIAFMKQANLVDRFATEKGTVSFFKRAGKSDKNLYFAFHNTAKIGSIIKLTNIGNEKTIYAKVIGKLPKTAAFYNSFVGISSDAKQVLDVRDEKAWCEIQFIPLLKLW